MTKVYLNAVVGSTEKDRSEAVLTVWKKSLLFNCKGYTVFDRKGDLLFRVDNYMHWHKGDILLMDAGGNPLLTIRCKRLSLGDCWLVYDGETERNPIFSVRKHFNILNPKCLAYVSSKKSILYWVEGSYAQRSCAVYDDSRRQVVAEIKRKEAAVGGVAFGHDIFRLIAQPSIQSAVAMALVILLDQMFGSNKRFH